MSAAADRPSDASVMSSKERPASRQREGRTGAARNGGGGRVNRRSLARLCAVQALYQMELTGVTLAQVVREYREHRLEQDLDGIPLGKTDARFFESLLRGVVGQQRQIDPLINSHLARGWRLARIDSILRAILRAGAYEMKSRRDVPPRVILNEYIDIAHAFFDGDEPRVVNAVMDALARQLRDGEVGVKGPGRVAGT